MTHLGAGSSPDDVRRMSFFYGGQFRYLRRHHGRAGELVGRAALVIGALLRRRWALIPLAVTAAPAQLQVASAPAAVRSPSGAPA